jgi:hypothetical protein
MAKSDGYEGNTMTLRWLPLICALALLAAPIAHAQYSWIDEKGTRVFSDRPPPPGTPPSRILQAPRAPGAASLYALPAAAAPATTDAKADAAKPQPPTLADRDAEFRKRTAQRDADERKAADEAQRKADLAEQCAAARRNEATLTSGERMADVDARGERVYVSDDDRARRLVQVRRFLANCR